MHRWVSGRVRTWVISSTSCCLDMYVIKSTLPRGIALHGGVSMTGTSFGTYTDMLKATELCYGLW